jgi:exonuclease SbcC
MREEALQRAEEAMKLAGEQLDTRKAEQKEALPGIRKAREIDLKIREKDAPITAAADSVDELQKACDALCSQWEDDCRNHDTKKRVLEEVLKYLSENGVDEALVGHLTGIRARFDALKNLRERHIAKIEDARGAEMRVAETTRIFNDKNTDLEACRRGLESMNGMFTHQQLLLKNVLEGRGLPDWRAALSELTGRKTLLEKVCEAVRSCKESRKSLDELHDRYDELVTEGANLASQLQAHLERHTSLEREMGLLETNLSLIRKIQSFEEARRQLRDGEPCPLCGSEEHPYAEGSIPGPDETRSELSRVRGELKAASEALAHVKVTQAVVNKDLEQITIRKMECVENISISEALISQGCADLAIEGSGRNLEDVLQCLQNENADSMDHAARVVQTAEAMENELAALRGSFEKTKDSLIQAEREMQAAAHSRDSAGQFHERVREEADALTMELNTALSGLRREMSAFGIETLSMDILDGVQIELAERRDRWVARQKERLELEQRIASLEVRIRHQQEQIRHYESDLKNRWDQLTALHDEQDALRRERCEVFSDRNPGDEEARLSLGIEAAAGDFDASREVFSAAFRELDTLRSRREGLEISMEARAVLVKSAEDVFLTRLNGLGFADEADYVAACLPEEERANLMRQAQKLADEQTGLVSMEREKVSQVETEQRKQITNDSRDELEQALTSLDTDQKELQQAIGAIRQRLADNENRKQQQCERTRDINLQKRECSRWDLLHELIGSADGKKYRNFAQGLTFEMMIGHANRQLRKMSDRYLLIRDDAQPLELNVIDDYQAGEIRSTKNLSGGESFIVSLSLALGLSHMASKNVRVDSLFLDEGFGTLDEDALDMALETLASLRQDGKLIGVISHVSALKERIATQIQVLPQTGGRSVLRGPGILRE